MNLKAFYFPEITISRRLRMLKNLLALAVLASVLISWRLWAGQRMFPMVPVFDSVPELNPWLEKIIFGIFLLLPVLILLARKPTIFIVSFLFVSVFLVLYDQSRIQPWFYQYFVMFFLLAFYNWRVDEPKFYTPVFNTLKLCIVFIFVWSGIHKLNSGFFHDTWPWMLNSMNGVFSHSQIKFLEKVGYVLPFVEIFGGFALFLPTVKRIAIPLLILVQLITFLLMGPLGHNNNPVLWPWNFFMIISVYVLFSGKTESKYNSILLNIQFKPAYVAVLLLGILPAFNLVNRWDSFMSNNFYPANTSSATIELTEEAMKKLPGYLHSFTKKTDNKQVLQIDSWGMYELQAPNYPEKRVYEAVTLYLKKITCCEEDVNLKFKEKSNIFAVK